MTITRNHWYRYSFIVASVVLLVLLAGCERETAQPPSPPPDPATQPDWVPELVEIPAGPFLMGSSDDDAAADDDEKPQHELTLDTYWIGKTEVTNAQFRPFVEGDGYSNPDYWTEAGWQWREPKAGWQWREEYFKTHPRYWDNSTWNGDAQPVIGVNWYEAVAYTRWLSAQTGRDYRLPTEAEWEKAARGTDGRIYPWGNDYRQEWLNSDDVIGRTTPVGTYPEGASPYGVLDMAGNVWEWTATKYDDSYKPYPYQHEDEWSEDYLAGSGAARVLRGGSWYSISTHVRCGARSYLSPNYRYNHFNGFRVVAAPHSP
jgi:formylglycine-generating enzyme required for sulfatase activity